MIHDPSSMIHDGKHLLRGCHSGPGPVRSGGLVPVGLVLVGPVPVGPVLVGSILVGLVPVPNQKKYQSKCNHNPK